MTCPFGSLGAGTIPCTATCRPWSRTLVEPTSLDRLLGNPLAARPLLIVVGRGRGRIRGPIHSRYCSTTAARASRSQLAFRVVRIFRLLGRVATALPRLPSTGQVGSRPEMQDVGPDPPARSPSADPAWLGHGKGSLGIYLAGVLRRLNTVDHGGVQVNQQWSL